MDTKDKETILLEASERRQDYQKSKDGARKRHQMKFHFFKYRKNMDNLETIADFYTQYNQGKRGPKTDIPQEYYNYLRTKNQNKTASTTDTQITEQHPTPFPQATNIPSTSQASQTTPTLPHAQTEQQPQSTPEDNQVLEPQIDLDTIKKEISDKNFSDARTAINIMNSFMQQALLYQKDKIKKRNKEIHNLNSEIKALKQEIEDQQSVWQEQEKIRNSATIYTEQEVKNIHLWYLTQIMQLQSRISALEEEKLQQTGTNKELHSKIANIEDVKKQEREAIEKSIKAKYEEQIETERKEARRAIHNMTLIMQETINNIPIALNEEDGEVVWEEEFPIDEDTQEAEQDEKSEKVQGILDGIEMFIAEKEEEIKSHYDTLLKEKDTDYARTVMNLNQLTLSIAATQSDKYFVSKDRYDQLIEEKMDLEDALGSYKSLEKNLKTRVKTKYMLVERFISPELFISQSTCLKQLLVQNKRLMRIISEGI